MRAEDVAQIMKAEYQRSFLSLTLSHPLFATVCTHVRRRVWAAVHANEHDTMNLS